MVLKAISTLMAAKISDGEDRTKLSLILILTANPANINRLNPTEAISNRVGLTYNPTNKPMAPNSWRYPARRLYFVKLYRTNSDMMNFE